MLKKDVLSCLNCGKCSGSCPVGRVMSNSTSDLTPRMLVREHLLFGNSEDLYSKFWYCSLCELCRLRCPAGVDYPDFVRTKRFKSLRYRNSYPETIKTIDSHLEEKLNIYGASGEDRIWWTYDVGEIATGRINKKSKVAYFVGCTTSSLGRLEGIPVSFVRILHRLNIDFTILGPEEWCCGNPTAVCEGKGNEQVLELCKRNVSKLNDLAIETLITSCAGCYRIFKLHYPDVLGHDLNFHVLHTSEFLAEMIENGNLAIQRKADKMVTYHDPCELGRIGGIFEEPRKVLEYAAGRKFVEVDQNREQTLCCGAGGLLRAAHPTIALEIAKLKLKEFKDVGANVVVSGCPACELNFKDAVLETKSNLEIMDIVEFVDWLLTGVV